MKKDYEKQILFRKGKDKEEKKEAAKKEDKPEKQTEHNPVPGYSDFLDY